MQLQTIHEVLKQYWGYDTFREPQEEIIKNILAGKDALIILATGGGKSLCFQLPAIISSGLTIVISPLIALMQDQVEGLKRKDIPAAFLNSTLLPGEYKNILKNISKYKLLYTSPEGLQSERLINTLKNEGISRVVLDEDHCLSEWGHDFRPDYKRIVSRLKNYGIVSQIVAFTATATKNTREEILRCLDIQEPFISVSTFDRKNLSFGAKKFYTPLGKFLYLKKLLSGSDKSLIYCSTRDMTEEVAARLAKKFGNITGYYHAGCSQEHRKKLQEEFRTGKIKYMCATTAFGMGIDIPDIDMVVYWNCPSSIEEYYQGIGRGGRDEKIQAKSWVLYGSFDIKAQKELLNEELPSVSAIKKILIALSKKESFNKIRDKFSVSESIINSIELIIEEAKLISDIDKKELQFLEKKLTQITAKKSIRFEVLKKYLSFEGCKRKYILNYFDEKGETNNCGNCSYCIK